MPGPLDAPPTAFRLTVPARFDGRDLHRGRHTLHVVGDAIAGAIDTIAGAIDTIAAAPHLDLGDRDVTLLPGLIDTHVHLAISHTDPSERALPHGLRALRMARNGRAQLRAGVTTVRDLGAPDGLDLQLRQAFAAGVALGPRLLVAGRPVVAVGGHASFMGTPVADATGAREAVARLVDDGVDWIKVMVTAGLSTPGAGPADQQLPREVIEAVVAAAHRAGLPVAAHAVAGPGVRDAVEAGVDSLEHGYALDDATIAAMVERGTTYVPTRTVVRLVAEGIAVDGVRPPEGVQATARWAEAVHTDSIRRAYAAGVTIVAGTDYRHGALPLEIELLVAAGVAPIDALRAATGAAARLLRRDDLGTLAIGAKADLVVVRGDPLRSPLGEAVLVVLGGRVVLAHPDLDLRAVGALDDPPAR
jgi:imidazolonepropionase-like amidohydrolase